jgi:hypothetical protein
LSCQNLLKKFLKKACPLSPFRAYLASVRQRIYLPLAITSLIAISSAVAHAQALAPLTLQLTSPEEAKKDVGPAIVKQPVATITKKQSAALTKKGSGANTEKRVAAITKKTARATEPAATLLAEPIRPIAKPYKSETTSPVARYSYKSPQGKKESVPVITQYYPKQIVYPFGKVDRHIDPKLMQAATIAQERAHAHSRSRCWHYVKDALLASGVIDSRPKSELARDAAQELVSNYGFKKLSVSDPFAAPVGSVLVYGTARSVGHVEFRTKDGFVSDFRSKTPSRRPLLGVYAKL